MKSRKILLLLILSVFLFTLAACAGEVGPQGPAGPAGSQGQTGQTGQPGAPGKDGEDGKDGKDGQDGKDGDKGTAGLTAYQIYKAAYPGYDGTEAEWLAELQAGKLSITVKVVYKNNSGFAFYNYSKGQELPTSPIGVDWYLDNEFEDAAKGTVLLENLTVYVNKAYEGVPISAGLMKVTSVHEITKGTGKEYTFVADDNVYVLAPNVVLRNYDGTVRTQTDAEFYTELHGAGKLIETSPYAYLILVNIEIVDGKVVSAKLASDNVSVSLEDDVELIIQNAATADTFKVHTYATVQEVLDSLKSTFPQTRVVLVEDEDNPGKYIPVVSSEVFDEEFLLYVLAEDQENDKAYYFETAHLLGTNGIGLEKNQHGSNKDSKKMVVGFNLVVGPPVARGNQVTLRPNTSVEYLLANIGQQMQEVSSKWVPVNKNFKPTITVENSEGVAKTGTAVLVAGDQIKVVAPGFPTVYYYVWIQKDDTAKVTKVTGASHVVSVDSTKAGTAGDPGIINVKYITKITDIFANGTLVAAELASAGQPQTYELKVGDDVYGTKPAHATKTIEDIRLHVKAQNGTTIYIYKFTVQGSVVSTLAVDPDYSYYASISGNIINVQHGLTIQKLLDSVYYSDTEKPLVGVQVKDSEGNNRTTLTDTLNNGDNIEIIAPFAGTNNVNKTKYTIKVNNILSSVDLVRVEEPKVITASTANTVSVNLLHYNGTAWVPVTVDLILGDLNEEQHQQDAIVVARYQITETVDGAQVTTEKFEKILNLTTAITTIEAKTGYVANSLKLYLRIYGQNNVMDKDELGTVLLTGSNYRDREISYNAKKTVDTISLVTAPKYIIGITGTTVKVRQSIIVTSELGVKSRQQVTDALIKADINFITNLQTISVDHSSSKKITVTPQDGAAKEYTIEIVKEDDVSLTAKDAEDRAVITDITEGTNPEIKVNVEYYNTLGTKTTTDFDAIIADTALLNIDNLLTQSFIFYVTYKEGETDRTATYSANQWGTFVTLRNNTNYKNVTLYLRITAENYVPGDPSATPAVPATGAIKEYKVTFNAKSSNKDITKVSKAADNKYIVEHSLQNGTINVLHGTTITLLKDAINEKANFQTIEVLNNKLGTKDKDALFTYDVLKVTAQDGTIKLYTITVNADVSVKDVALETIEITSTTTATVQGIINRIKIGTVGTDRYITIDDLSKVTKAQLLSVLVDANGSKDISVHASDSVKTKDALFIGDKVIVKKLNGTATDLVVYTIVQGTPANNALGLTIVLP